MLLPSTTLRLNTSLLAVAFAMSDQERPHTPSTSAARTMQQPTTPDRTKQIEINRLRGKSLFLHVLQFTFQLTHSTQLKLHYDKKKPTLYLPM